MINYHINKLRNYWPMKPINGAIEELGQSEWEADIMFLNRP